MLGDKHLKKTRLGITDVNFPCVLTQDHNTVAVLQLSGITKRAVKDSQGYCYRDVRQNITFKNVVSPILI